jgi:hypothetical protein
LRHFADHGVGVNAATPDLYDRSAHSTIGIGKRFTYTDRTTGLKRVGYWEAATRKFTALTYDETIILSHFRARRASYPRTLPASDYA